jgi:tRNA1(Val) A37 N6-methylase TrmN6
MKPWDIGEHQLALDSVKHIFKGCVLDIGSGLGDNSIWISSLPDVIYVLGVEILEDSVKDSL